MKDDIDVADFSKLLNNNEEIDVDYIDMKETIDEKDVGLKFEILGYWNHKPILRKYNQYICCLGSKKQLLIINTNIANHFFLPPLLIYLHLSFIFSFFLNKNSLYGSSSANNLKTHVYVHDDFGNCLCSIHLNT